MDMSSFAASPTFDSIVICFLIVKTHILISLLFCAIQFNLLQFKFNSISACLMDMSSFAASPTFDSIVICFLIVKTHILISLLFCAIQFNLLQFKFNSISACLMDMSSFAASPTFDSIVICFLILKTHILISLLFCAIQFNLLQFKFNSISACLMDMSSFAASPTFDSIVICFLIVKTHILISLLFCAIQFNLLQFKFNSISACLMDMSSFAASPTFDSIVICFLIVKTHILISLLFCAIQFNLLQFKFNSISACLMDMSSFTASPTFDRIVICFLIVKTHILISLLFCAIQFNLLQFKFNSISACLMDMSSFTASPTLDRIVICFLIVKTHILIRLLLRAIQFNLLKSQFNSISVCLMDMSSFAASPTLDSIVICFWIVKTHILIRLLFCAIQFNKL